MLSVTRRSCGSGPTHEPCSQIPIHRRSMTSIQSTCKCKYARAKVALIRFPPSSAKTFLPWGNFRSSFNAVGVGLGVTRSACLNVTPSSTSLEVRARRSHNAQRRFLLCGAKSHYHPTKSKCPRLTRFVRRSECSTSRQPVTRLVGKERSCRLGIQKGASPKPSSESDQPTLLPPLGIRGRAKGPLFRIPVDPQPPR